MQFEEWWATHKDGLCLLSVSEGSLRHIAYQVWVAAQVENTDKTYEAGLQRLRQGWLDAIIKEVDNGNHTPSERLATIKGLATSARDYT